MALSCAWEISQSVEKLGVNGTDKLFVFVIRNNLEGMLSYFTASLLRVRAFIVNVNDLSIVQETIDSSAIATYVMHKDIREIVALNQRISVSFGGEISLPVNGYELAESHYACARFYFCTSGTTSRPKLIQYHEDKLIGNAVHVAEYLTLNSNDKTLCFFPVQYMYGLSTMLCSFISEGDLFFDLYNISTIGELVERNKITNLPLIGDWMLPISKIFEKRNIKLKNILNASDRLLTVQAKSMIPYCEVLWNNFGQTESGPRIFCNKLTSVTDIENTSYVGVVAPGKVMVPEIKVQLSQGEELDSDCGYHMVYQSPFSFDGYVNSVLELSPKPEWINSGDLFKMDSNGYYYWISRSVNEFKYNGKFVPIQLISNDILLYVGNLKHYFKKDDLGKIKLIMDNDISESELNRVKNILEGEWYHYSIEIIARKIQRTRTGKIKIHS
ncbi:Long-chain-fatty-acid--CoA ligase [Vibrio spartinae]|uniref:Long-chain-fatty-acid--CoA ligase n=2 Tax=Vibrio spartinae TaxID=1918945 RepID=A0A1N6M5Y9_9VIBR|nr:Long-chain-fatty-acid--CoA ligase [Vibrio spartinae]